MPDPGPHARASSWVGFRTLLGKEVLRFWKVAFQTILAPVLNALLFLLIFSHVLDRHVTVYGDIAYTAFLVPGLVMMSLLQNAFANSSSSLIQSKITGNIIFMLLPPIAYHELYAAYVIASVLRALMVGVGVLVVSLPFVDVGFFAPGWIIAFAIIGGATLGTLGMIAGIWADKFDQLSAFQNFLIMPLTMLSGVFFSIHSLPEIWQDVLHTNPFFFMIDGFRYGFFGQSDVNPWLSLGVAGVFFLFLAALTLAMLARGYKLRS